MEVGQTKSYDVIVVGAGLSGLQAAYDIQNAGLSCLVLEARDRVGGKTWTRKTKNGKLVDVGAAWINDTNQARIYEWTKRLNLDLIEQNTNGYCVMQEEDGSVGLFEYGSVPKFSPQETENMIKIRDLVESLSHATTEVHRQYDNMTFEQLVRKHGGGSTALATAKIWTRAMLGRDPFQVSAMYVLDYYKRLGGLLQARSDRKDGGQYLRIRQDCHWLLARACELRPLALAGAVGLCKEFAANPYMNTKDFERSYWELLLPDDLLKKDLIQPFP
ncbi:predicted protein [Coccidioides posadasii str. Silveira]|uniref:Amine oxidase n=1 Tax=Coccidioides posadasii (strain RMSCC 757 / Silveira) TaxID=443226 RepID=E9DHL7_COCPS|nr:predicted protein [Coccidioides posadasii str. Silveira]